MTAIDDVLQSSKMLWDHLEKATETYHNGMSKVWETLPKALFSSFPGLDVVVIRGWTPGFNDGSPCVHGMTVIVTSDDMEDYGFCADDLDEDVLEALGETAKLLPNEDEDSDEDSENKAGVNKKLSKEDADKISTLLYRFSDFFEREYETNWQLTLYRTPTGGEFQKSDYDCGY